MKLFKYVLPDNTPPTGSLQRNLDEHYNPGFYSPKSKPATLEDLKQAAKELGMVLVPKEPTTAMRVAGGLECPDHEGDKCETASQVYKAMIEAEGEGND